MTGRVAELAATEGLDFDFDAALTVNTLDAHRLRTAYADETAPPRTGAARS